MKLPKSFRTEKDLEKKIEHLVEGPDLIKVDPILTAYYLLEGYRDFFKQANHRSVLNLEHIGKLVVRELDYTYDDIKKFAMDVRTIEPDTKLWRYPGMYLSSLINKKLTQHCTLTLKLDAELHHIGHKLQKGNLIIEGDLGYRLGDWMEGGEIIVKGNAGDQTGAWMEGGRIVVHGSVGEETGWDMHKGRIIVYGKVKSTFNLCKVKRYKTSTHIYTEF